MQQKCSSWILWIIMLAVPACSPKKPLSLQNTMAAAIIQQRWNEAAAIRINLGTVQFSQSNVSSEPRTAMPEYSMYQAAARMRLIKLESDRKGDGTGDPITLTPAGAPRILNVSLTTEGEKIAIFQNAKAGNLRSARFQCGEYHVKKIILNKPLQIYGENSAAYRTVLGTHVFESKPETHEICPRRGGAETGERHFRALLKHDPILDRWSLAASDEGSGAFDYESENVPLTVAALRADRRSAKR